MDAPDRLGLGDAAGPLVPTAESLRLARATVDALADLPTEWDDEHAVLTGFGRDV
ncbi:hypothetical protein [Pseudonocardia xishanensis]|uniref:hypothetical protein n=1 Tax=Pseudonocardia xishanensis TaxID=630995 RepID=UPI0031EA329C